MTANATSAATTKSNKGLWLGLAGSLLFCLCSLGFAALVVTRLGQQFARRLETDPQGASKTAHAIADYELPAGYEEKLAMDFFAYTMVVIGPDSFGSFRSVGKPMMLLTEFRVATNRLQMEQQIRTSLEQQSRRSGLKMKVTETRQMTLRGKPAEVTYYEGTDDEGAVLKEVTVTFQGKGGTAMLAIMGDAAYWDREEIDTFIASIH